MEFGVGPLRPSYFRPPTDCMPRSCAMRMAIPRYIQSPLSRLAPNLSYARSNAACTTATLGHGKASGIADFARWAKAWPCSEGGTFGVSVPSSFCWSLLPVSIGCVENRAANAQTASTRMASTCFSSKSRKKRSLCRKGKEQPRCRKNSLQRWVMSGLGDIDEASYTGISAGVRASGAGGEPTDGCAGEDSIAC